MIDIHDLDKAEVLKALYDASHHQGMGFLSAVPDSVVTVEHCRDLLASNTYFDYLYGKVMKVDLRDDFFDERLYDRDNGPGAAQRAVDKLRDKKRNLPCSLKFTLDYRMGISIQHDPDFNEFKIHFENRDALDHFIAVCESCREYYE